MPHDKLIDKKSNHELDNTVVFVGKYLTKLRKNIISLDHGSVYLCS